jgi:hypothetical protein
MGTVRGVPIYVSGGGIGDTGIFADLVEEIEQFSREVFSFDAQLRNKLPPGAVTLHDENKIPTTDSKKARGLFVNRNFVSNPLVQFYAFSWIDFRNDWIRFHDKQTEFAEKLKRQFIATGRNIWKDIQDYRAKLVVFHEKAQEAGFNLTGPAPSPPKKSIFVEAKDALAGPVEALWKIVKIAFYVAVGVVVILVVAYAVKTMRGPHTVISP